MKVLHDGQAVILGLEKLNLDDFPDLRVIGCNMTGTEHLPEKEMAERGIKLMSLKGETEFLQTITSTAEHTIGLIIALLRNYKTALSGPYKDREAYKGHVLRGKTLGIIGLGRVGKQVLDVARALQMRTFGYDVLQPGGRNANNQDILLEESDIVSLHIPLFGNEGFFTRYMFAQMKPSAYFINTSRDAVVQQGALLWALKNKVIAGAAVDFVDDEELVWYARDHDNLILTNHQGGNTHEDTEKTENFITQKVTEYVQSLRSTN